MTLKYLACPNCSSTFRIPVAAMGEEGKTVRCSQCAHEWHAHPKDLFDSMLDKLLTTPQDREKAAENASALNPLQALSALLDEADSAQTPSPLDPELKELIANSPVFSKDVVEESVDSVVAPEEDTVSQQEKVEEITHNPLEDLFGAFPVAPAAPIIDASDAPSSTEEPEEEKAHWSDIVIEQPQHEKFNPDLEPELAALESFNPVRAAMDEAAFLSEQNQRMKIRLLVIANAASVLMMLFIGLIAFRDTIIATVPSLTSFYQVIGFASSHNLTLAELEYDRKRSGSNRWRYVVRGVVVNQGKEPTAMPTLRARLFTHDGILLNDWEIAQDDAILTSGESRQFTTRNLYSTAQNAHVLSVDVGSSVELMLRK